MALLDRFRKASPPKGGRDIAPLVRALTQAMEAGQQDSVRPLSRPEEWIRAKFGPNWPIEPQPLDIPREDSGLPEPRISEYPVAWNVPGVQGRHIVPWEVLRKAAESPLMRACIEARKKDITSLDWTVGVSTAAVNRIAEASGRSKPDVEKELRDKYRAEIDRANDFWAIPDRKNGHKFAGWLGLLMEEQLTHDSLCVYPRKRYGGELIDFWSIDGSTIKPLRDETGGRPEPPYPAYQQILYGYPRGEFTADTVTVDGKSVVPGALTATQLVYERRVERTWTPFGFSPVEQALLDGMLWSKRFQWIVGEYTEGAQPVQWIINKGTSDWSARQLLEYERMFNDRYSGQTAERYRNPFLPDGLEPVKAEPLDSRYKPDYDLFIIKLVAMHFGVTMPRLGFTEPGGLGASGYHEGQADVQYKNTTLPDARWFAALLTALQTAHLDTPPELEFKFLGLDEEDEAATDAVAESRVKTARMTINEDRARLGLPALRAKEADMPMIQTARGVVFIEGASDVAPAGTMIEPASEQEDTDPAAGTKPVAKPGSGSPAAAAKKELAAYHKWAFKHPAGSRPFQFEHMTEELAADLAPELLKAGKFKLAAKAGGSGPKATSSNPSSNGPAGSSTSSWSPYSSPS